MILKPEHEQLNATPMKLAKDELLLIDSLHGLYPDFSKDISIDVKFKLYLEPLLTDERSGRKIYSLDRFKID